MALAPQRLALAEWARQTQPSELRGLAAVAMHPDTLSLALGFPDPALLPSAACTPSAAHVLATDPDALQYGVPSQGLKRHVVALMARRGVRCREEQVFLTTGAQQAMDLLVRLLLEPGRTVLVEEATYEGMLLALRPFRPAFVTVPTDPETGLDVDAVAKLLKGGTRPALLYTISDGHNPTGASLSRDKRAALVGLARCHGLPIIEDDAYGLLHYGETPPPPPLRALDEEWVFYLGSFSKIMAPGLRVGWTVVPEPLISRLSSLKQGSDLDVGTFSQRTLCAFLDRGLLQEHVAMLRREYGARRDSMLRALREWFPDDAHWSRPEAGFYVWVELRRGMDMIDLLRNAIERTNVAFVPGQAFRADGRPSPPCMRLSFSQLDPERIREAVARLGRLLT